MNVVSDYSDYLNRRLAGENVISAATMYGVCALKQIPDLKDFCVLSLNDDSYSIYTYRATNGQFSATNKMPKPSSHEFVKNVEDFSSVSLRDKTMMRWWNCVFFEQDGKRQYDTAYDELLIAENNTRCFKDIINHAKEELLKLSISESELAAHVLLTGNLAANPLVQYILQVILFPSKVITTLKLEQNEIIEEKQFVVQNDRLDKNFLHTNQDISLSLLASHPVCITIPLDSIDMGSKMLRDLTWGEMIIYKPDDEQDYDYTAYNLKFKNIKLRVDYDVFNNIFITSEDMHGHRKVALIN